MGEIIFSLNNVSKKFCRSLNHSMVYGIFDVLRLPYAIPQAKRSSLRKKEFWAVDNVSFQLREGEILGIIGSNGSGKSTLLKMINGIFPPDIGSIEVHGRVGALIEVGAGFHPLLSGRENIFINGTILGMTKDQIEERFDQIVDFAEIADFLDSPVKTYSSGMYVRLGFAIALHSAPDILLVDEALAVGDLYFKSKCFQAMNNFFSYGKGIVFISHDINMVRRFCTRVVWLEKGRVLMDGDVTEVTNGYIESVNRKIIQKRHLESFRNSNENLEVYIREVSVVDSSKQSVHSISFGSDLMFRIDYIAHKEIKKPNFGIGIFTENGIRVTNTCTAAQNCSPDRISGPGTFICHYQNIPLMPGRYNVAIAIKDERGLIVYDRQERIAHFSISSGDCSREENEDHGLLHMLADWYLES